MITGTDVTPPSTIHLQPQSWTILRKVYRDPKVVGRRGGTTGQRGSASDIAGAEFAKFADAVAVLKGVRPRFLGWIEKLSNDALGGGFSSGGKSGRAPTSIMLSTPDASKLCSLRLGIEAVLKYPKAKAVELAVRRMGFASMRERWEDQFLDVMIAIESLLLSDQKSDRGGELSFRIALRAAQALPNGIGDYTSGEVFVAMRRAYDVRSSLAHGGDVDVTKGYRIRDRTVTLEQLLRFVMDVSQSLCDSGIQIVLKDNRYFIDWDLKLSAHLDSY
ncbi:MAG: hypothetical protein NVSMB64_21050 [Candidatus Velthaea sp.]